MSSIRWAMAFTMLANLGCRGTGEPSSNLFMPEATNRAATAAAPLTATPPPSLRAVTESATSFPEVAASATVVDGASLEVERISVATMHEGDQPLRINLFQALETSLLQNPDLTALRRNEGVSVGALGVAQTYPFNPFVQVQVTPFQDAKNGAGAGTTYHYVLLMQTLQLGHQQRFREQNAMAALNSVRWNILQAELLNVAQTERLYFTALYQCGLRDLAIANAQLNDQLLTVVEKRLEAGDATGAEAAISRLDNRSARQQAKLAEANYQTALLDLRRQLNIPASLPLEVSDNLDAWTWLSPNLSEPGSSSELADSRPDVMAARCDIAAARANADIARGSRIPDLQIGPYYQRTESGTSYLGFRAQNDIPVWNNGVPLVRQRDAEVRQRTVVWQQLQVRASLEAEAALARYERALQMLKETDTSFHESFPSELQRLEQQFRAGEVDFLRVVTARTSLLQVRRVHLDMLNEAAQAAVAVTAATGLPPETIVQSRPAH